MPVLTLAALERSRQPSWSQKEVGPQQPPAPRGISVQPITEPLVGVGGEGEGSSQSWDQPLTVAAWAKLPSERTWVSPRLRNDKLLF